MDGKDKDRRERRKFKRYRVQEGAMAVFQNKESRLGPIQDISRGGLSFVYFTDNGRIHGSDEMGIFHPGEDFYLTKVPFITIYEKKGVKSDPFSILRMNKRGIQFGKMIRYQKSLLDYFIKNYTIENGPPVFS